MVARDVTFVWLEERHVEELEDLSLLCGVEEVFGPRGPVFVARTDAVLVESPAALLGLLAQVDHEASVARLGCMQQRKG